VISQHTNLANKVATPIISLVSIGAVGVGASDIVLAGLAAYVLLIVTVMYLTGR
jgi:hypothetical protein